jgi:ABC-type maltose transport system permease subunit
MGKAIFKILPPLPIISLISFLSPLLEFFLDQLTLNVKKKTMNKEIQ